jgi:hypothetical protein
VTLLKSKAVILAKIETVYGTDAVPTAALNAILCENPDVEPLTKKVERNNVKPFYGSLPFVSIGEGLKISFTTELKGKGVAPAITPPEIGVLFRACNFTETIVATPGSECVKYNPHSNPDGESLTIYFYRHNVLHKAVGCRGTGPELDGKVNEYGKLKWEFQGLYDGPVDQNIPASPVFNTTKPPLFRNAQFALDDYAAVIESIKVSVKNDLGKRPDANSETGILSYFVKERKVTGEIDPEMVPIATKDFWGMWEGGSMFNYSASFGSVAGNRCVISAAGVQLDALKYADRDNILTLGMPLVFVPVAGDDDVEFKFS